jgi:hypothetical protein
MMKRLMAMILGVVMIAPGCAAKTRYTQATPVPIPGAGRDVTLMAQFVRQLPVGSRVKITRTDGSVLRGTLMRRDTDPIVLQQRTRLPEPPVEVAISEIATLEPQNGGTAGRAIAIGAAAGAGAALGVMLLIVAIFAE